MVRKVLLLTLLIIVVLAANYASAGGNTQKPYYVVGAYLSVSGPNAPLGTPQRDTLLMLEEQINKSGGINGHPLKIVIEDDGSDNTMAVKAAKKLIEQDNVCALIGGSGTGPTLAVAPLAEAVGVPQISMAAGIAITNPIKKWVFRVALTDTIAAGKILDYLNTQGITKIAVIYDSNAFGTSGRDQLKVLAPKYQASVVAQESFSSKDTDMTAQLTKIRASAAQAIVCWGTNPGPAQVAKNVQQLGITIPLLMSHGVANQTFLDQAGPAANGIILPAVKLIVANDLPDTDPQKGLLLKYNKDFQEKFNRAADHYGGHAWDALNLIVNALKRDGDDRAKLRDQIENTSHFFGIGGIINFSLQDHDGLSPDACAMLKIVDGKWTILKRGSSPIPTRPSKTSLSFKVDNSVWVKTDKPIYQVNEPIQVQYGGFPGNTHDWISIALASKPNEAWDDYLWTNGAASGSLKFNGLGTGTYEVRGYYDWNGTQSYQVRCRYRFRVFSGEADLTLNRTTFHPGEEIQVYFHAPGTWPQDAWIGIIPSNIEHGSEAVNDAYDITYQYINGVTSGTMVFIAPGPGKWDIRMNDTDSNGKEVTYLSFIVR